MEKLKLAAGMTGEQKRYAVEAALLLGFQTETATFPVITADGEIPVPENMEELKALWKKSTGETPEEYESASKHTGPIFDLDFRKEKGLETMLQKGDFLKDENQDLLPDVLDVKIVLPEDADDAMLVAACNLAWRFGMETTGYKGNITADADYTGNRQEQKKAEQTELVREKEGESVKVSLRGDGEELIAFTSRLCMEFPQINGQRSWKDLLMDMVDDFVLRSADGQLAALKAMQKEQTGEYEVYGSPLWNDTQKKEAGDAKVYNYKSGQKMYEKVYELPWEVEVFEKLLEEKVYPQIRKGSKVKITGAVSENIKVRQKIKEKIEDRIQMLGAKPEDTSVICAYKQGYSWIVEEMLPVMKEAQADQVEIYFKPFLPEGQTDWLDENGATPSYHNLNADTPDKWYDLPIRYLQELYPVEDILVKGRTCKEAPHRASRCGASLRPAECSGEKPPSRPRIPCAYSLEVGVGGGRGCWGYMSRLLFRALRERRTTLARTVNVAVALTCPGRISGAFPHHKLPSAYLRERLLVLHLQLLFQGGVEFPTGGKSGGAKGVPWRRRGACDRADESATRVCVGSHAG